MWGDRIGDVCPGSAFSLFSPPPFLCSLLRGRSLRGRKPAALWSGGDGSQHGQHIGRKAPSTDQRSEPRAGLMGRGRGSLWILEPRGWPPAPPQAQGLPCASEVPALGDVPTSVPRWGPGLAEWPRWVSKRFLRPPLLGSCTTGQDGSDCTASMWAFRMHMGH